MDFLPQVSNGINLPTTKNLLPQSVSSVFSTLHLFAVQRYFFIAKNGLIEPKTPLKRQKN
jgi:hypothetical protein